MGGWLWGEVAGTRHQGNWSLGGWLSRRLNPHLPLSCPEVRAAPFISLHVELSQLQIQPHPPLLGLRTSAELLTRSKSFPQPPPPAPGPTVWLTHPDADLRFQGLEP